MDDKQPAYAGVSRRQFFGYAAALTGAGLLAGTAGCNKVSDNHIYMGSGNLALMNYIYLVEQLQASFYLKALERPWNEIKKEEVELFQQLRDHELAQRGFLKVLLGSDGIPELTPDFSTVNFEDRYSVLSTARQIEDTSVAAYNGVAKLMTDTGNGSNYLIHLAKMAVVQARHAATIRELLEPDSFADSTILDANHLDGASDPGHLMTYIDGYFFENLNSENLPKF